MKEIPGVPGSDFINTWPSYTDVSICMSQRNVSYESIHCRVQV